VAWNKKRIKYRGILNAHQGGVTMALTSIGAEGNSDISIADQDFLSNTSYALYHKMDNVQFNFFGNAMSGIKYVIE